MRECKLMPESFEMNPMSGHVNEGRAWRHMLTTDAPIEFIARKIQ